jgi:hypothetical protein
MAWTIDTALSEPEVEVIDRDDSAGDYTIRLAGINQLIGISLGKRNRIGMIPFSLTHAIKTPKQAGAYRTSRPFADYEGYALHQAISGLTHYYRDAVRDGLEPDHSWLEPY